MHKIPGAGQISFQMFCHRSMLSMILSLNHIVGTQPGSECQNINQITSADCTRGERIYIGKENERVEMVKKAIERLWASWRS